MRRVAVLIAVVAGLAGCGGSGESSSAGTVLNADTSLTEQQIARQAGFTPDSAGIAWNGPSGCSVSVILNSQAEIDLYAGAGDTVVTDPTGTIGVKTADDPRCIPVLGAALKHVDVEGQ